MHWLLDIKFKDGLSRCHCACSSPCRRPKNCDWLVRRGTTPVIPNKINRRKPSPYKRRAYRHRNKIERMFCRLKDARRIATRDD